MTESCQATPDPTFLASNGEWQLSYIERMLVRTMRLWAFDRRRWIEAIVEFNRICGPRHATLVCEALHDMFYILGTGARRTVRLYPSACAHSSHDERCMLTILAAIQNEEEARGAAVAQWLLRQPAAEEVMVPAQIAGATLLEKGYRLPLRAAATAPLRKAWHQDETGHTAQHKDRVRHPRRRGGGETGPGPV